MAKKIPIIFLSIFIFTLFTAPVEAKRLLPRFQGSGSTAAAPASYYGVGVSPKLRGDRLALIVIFNGLQNATSVSYTLTYETNGINQGVGGTIKSSAETSATRELAFGTCSAGVCTYHTNITGMRFEVVSKLTNGKTSIKRYQINV